MVSTLTKICEQVCEVYVPQKCTSKKKEKIPRDWRILMRKRSIVKARLTKKTSKCKEIKLQEVLKDIEIKLLMSHEEQRRREELQAISNIKINSKCFFAFANKKVKNISSVGPLEDDEGNLVSDPKGMALMLKRQFEKVLSLPSPEDAIDDPATFFAAQAATSTPTL
ncbi:hypothetical protein Pcinc_007112 [Petrolisthes cinctipes]|uniref:Uncharacterized protein n=1 Tax=Petrolisthes cinctipes TaxID=88211 RepID=A0AAE1KX94_PETCI|nr:hypothetical protein Pcinc_015648 [Petrolisthes cinctipes]KAK3888846.1 hypothetical protein Pcinc_007112 [Petrolisthes cinctipes]